MELRARPAAELAWPEVLASGPVLLVVPIGSFEQHGPHLPLATDTVIAEALSRRLADRAEDLGLADEHDSAPTVLIGPTLTVTASGEHQGFPGTLSIGTEATATVIIELQRSASWAAGTVLVNGHGGNREAVNAAMRQLGAEGHRIIAWWPRIADGDLHAGRTETSLMLALRPDAVRRVEMPAGPQPDLATLQRTPIRELSPTGVLGDPTGASAAEGTVLFDQLGEQLGATVREQWREWYPNGSVAP